MPGQPLPLQCRSCGEPLGTIDPPGLISDLPAYLSGPLTAFLRWKGGELGAAIAGAIVRGQDPLSVLPPVATAQLLGADCVRCSGRPARILEAVAGG